MWCTAYCALRIESEQRTRTAIAPGAGTERQECALWVSPVSRKKRECFKVGLLLLTAVFGIGQCTVENPDQLTGTAVRRAKYTKVKLVVSNDVDELINTREPACGA